DAVHGPTQSSCNTPSSYRSNMTPALGPLLGSPFDKVLVFAVTDQHAGLVMDGELQCDCAGRPARLELAHLEHGIEGVAAIDRLQEARGLLEEAAQRIADDMREDAGAGRALDRHLQAVCQHVAVPPRLAVLPVVVDRMVVAACQLERREQRLG